MKHKHNSLDNAGAAQLLAYVRRIETLDGEIADVEARKRQVYGEVRACGFCKKTLRKLVKLRRTGVREDVPIDPMLDLYDAAVADMKG
jgi:uncharacterized protein (UPF0335 family)